MFQMNKTKLENYYQFDRDNFDRVMEYFGRDFELAVHRMIGRNFDKDQLMAFNKEVINQVATACLTRRLAENKIVFFDDIEWIEWHYADVYVEIMALSLAHAQEKLRYIDREQLYALSKILFKEMQK
jgi:hypothetical protein